MKHYAAWLYVSIDAQSEEEAREIASSLAIVPEKKAHTDRIFCDAQNTEVTEVPL